MFHERTKHIELDCHFVREKLLDGLISLLLVPSSSQVANIFTKALAGPLHQHFLGKLGVRSSGSHLNGGVENIGTLNATYLKLLTETMTDKSMSN